MRDREWCWQSTSTTRWQLCKLFKASLSTGQGNRDSSTSRDSTGRCRGSNNSSSGSSRATSKMAQVAIYQLKLCLTTRTPEDSHQKKSKMKLLSLESRRLNTLVNELLYLYCFNNIHDVLGLIKLRTYYLPFAICAKHSTILII